MVSIAQVREYAITIAEFRKATGWTRQVYVALLLAFIAGGGVTLGIMAYLNTQVLIAQLQAGLFTP